MQVKIEKTETKDVYDLKVIPFIDGELSNCYKIKKRELYEFYVQLRNIFENKKD